MWNYHNTCNSNNPSVTNANNDYDPTKNELKPLLCTTNNPKKNHKQNVQHRKNINNDCHFLLLLLRSVLGCILSIWQMSEFSKPKLFRRNASILRITMGWNWLNISVWNIFLSVSLIFICTIIQYKKLYKNNKKITTYDRGKYKVGIPERFRHNKIYIS